MNIAHNMVTNIEDLIHVLITPYVNANSEILLTTYEDGDTLTKAFYTMDSEEVCRVVYSDKGIIFYEKSNKDNDKQY